MQVIYSYHIIIRIRHVDVSLWEWKTFLKTLRSEILHQTLKKSWVACNNSIHKLRQHPLHGILIVNSPSVNLLVSSVQIPTCTLRIIHLHVHKLIAWQIQMHEMKFIPVENSHKLLIYQWMVYTNNISTFHP